MLRNESDKRRETSTIEEKFRKSQKCKKENFLKIQNVKNLPKMQEVQK